MNDGLEEYGLHSAFDIEKHKKTFINYLEVAITEDGTILYAVPSHVERFIQIAMEKLCVGRKELYDMCPVEYYFRFIEWLSIKSGAIAVWDGYCIAASVTKAQCFALKKLKLHGLYKGKIPEPTG
jgi:hypothetical protein